MTGSADTADDLVQSACERAVRNVRQWKPGTRLDSWMFRIVQNAYIDSRRSDAARRHHIAAHGHQADGYTDGEAIADAHVTLAQVRHCVNGLADEFRSVFLLVCVEGFSYREAADILDVPIGTVMSRLARARGALGKRFETRAAAPRQRVS